MDEREEQQFGNYQSLEFLVQDGFAEVWLGEDVRSATEIAIKLFYTSLRQDEIAIFLEEADALTNLDHPNIVRVRDFGVKASTNTNTLYPYLVMDYTLGSSLREHYPRGTRLPLPTMIAYVNQIAKALQYAHNEQVIHGAVRPENILLVGNGELLLSDLGIAQLLSKFGIAKLSQTESTWEHSAYNSADTSPYMAPEQFRGKPERASDQYALAIMVYEWLCGKLPFSGSVESDLQPVSSLHEQLPGIPLAIEQVVRKALAEKPKERFDSVSAFAAALEQVSQDTGDAREEPAPLMTFIPATTIKPPPEQNETEIPTSRPITRRAALFGAGSAVGLALLCTAIWWETRKAALPLSSQPVRAPSPQPSGPQGTLYQTYRGHSALVLAVVWSPDGKRIASGSFDGTVQVWNAVNGGNVFTYRGHADAVDAVAWSPDGKRIASGSYDHTVQIWDAANGSDVFTYRGHSDVVRGVAWSPNGKRIVSGCDDGIVQVWDAVNGGNVFIYGGHSSAVLAVAWSPDSKHIASGSLDRTVQVWNAINGGNVFIYHGHYNYVVAVTWSPDSKRIASGSLDGTVQVWNATNGGNVFIYQKHTAEVYAAAWSPDGKRIASGSGDQTVQVWDAVNGDNVFIYRRHSGHVNAVAWSPDSQRIASGSDDMTVQVWQA